MTSRPWYAACELADDDPENVETPSDLVSALKKAIEDWHSAEQKADVLHSELSEIADLLSKEGF